MSIVLIFTGFFLIIKSFSGVGVDFKGRPIGIMLLGQSITAILLSAFTLKKKNWARIALGIFVWFEGGFILRFIQVILMSFIFPSSFYNEKVIRPFHSIFSITTIIIFVLIMFVFWYLLFNKKVKEAFEK